MVEDEYRRPRRPQVLLAVDVQSDSGERQRGLGPRADREVRSRPAASREQPETDPGCDPGAQPRERRPRADYRQWPGPAARLEPVDLPAALACEPAQPAVRVQRARPSDSLEIGEILLPFPYA